MTTAKHPDEVSPRKPGDPPWRSRTAHRSCNPRGAAALRGGRLSRGWSIQEAGRQTGVSRRMIGMLEAAQRRPSTSTAETLIGAYGLTGEQANDVRSIALADVGRDSPYRSPGTRTGP